MNLYLYISHLSLNIQTTAIVHSHYLFIHFYIFLYIFLLHFFTNKTNLLNKIFKCIVANDLLRLRQIQVSREYLRWSALKQQVVVIFCSKSVHINCLLFVHINCLSPKRLCLALHATKTIQISRNISCEFQLNCELYHRM